MHKNIVLCDGLPDDYLRNLDLFMQEWQSQAETIQVNTSGSTGNPKHIKLSKKKIIASAKATGSFFGFKANQSLLLNLSTDYIAGKLMLIRALVHDMKIFIAPNTKNPLANLEFNELDFGAFVPYQLQAILNNDNSCLVYQNIRNVIIGGAPLSIELENRIKTLGNSTYATFGMTETLTHIALRNVSKGEDTYTCLPGVTVATDERGCLIIHKNAINEELVTNDLVDWISETKFRWKGRIDYMVNSAGIKIFPEQLERQLEKYMDGNRFYFAGRPSKQFGEELVLYIEGESENWNRISEKLEAILDKYKRPKAVIFLAQFEETATGKIIRKKS